MTKRRAVNKRKTIAGYVSKGWEPLTVNRNMDDNVQAPRKRMKSDELVDGESGKKESHQKDLFDTSKRDHQMMVRLTI